MKPLVLMTHPLNPEVISKKLKPHVRVKQVSFQKLSKELPSADGLICLLSDSIQDKLLSQAKNLKVIGNYAVGFDNIDLEACKKRKIRVVNTPKVLTRATAELTLALLFAVARRFPEGEALCRSGNFKGWKPDLLLGLELQGKKAIIVGAGRIGKVTGKLFEKIGLKVEWITRKDSPSQIRNKLRRAEILSLHLPYGPKTHHWLSKQRIAQLPKNAIVINTARGAIVDEKALTLALERGKLWGIGLDVYEHEPRISPSLRRHPRAVLLPHLGSATEQTRKAMTEVVVNGVLTVLRGKRPWNTVV